MNCVSRGLNFAICELRIEQDYGALDNGEIDSPSQEHGDANYAISHRVPRAYDGDWCLGNIKKRVGVQNSYDSYGGNVWV